jgi:hypothetical protein
MHYNYEHMVFLVQQLDFIKKTWIICCQMTIKCFEVYMQGIEKLENSQTHFNLKSSLAKHL